MPASAAMSKQRVKDTVHDEVHSARSNRTSSGGRGCCLLDARTLEVADRKCEKDVVAVGVTPLRHVASLAVSGSAPATRGVRSRGGGARVVLSLVGDTSTPRRDLRSAAPGYRIAGAGAGEVLLLYVPRRARLERTSRPQLQRGRLVLHDEVCALLCPLVALPGGRVILSSPLDDVHGGMNGERLACPTPAANPPLCLSPDKNEWGWHRRVDGH
ncbi:hypothetical protein R3P38DRAFT_3239453 [Favolaschia claudopus]|uniref:Uncharacterized protein n=1 Tax=Favolaschia claudopus TaxID=2862362 RepID=A0AAV9Z8I8_9AGAR